MITFELLDLCAMGESFVYSFNKRENAVKAMEAIFFDAYAEDREQVDYEGLDPDAGYATDSNGERWLEIVEVGRP